MLSKVGSYEFLVEPFHCDFEGRIFLGHLANHLLNAADFHSNDRGCGMNYLNTVNKTWVLSRLVMQMDSLPKAYDRITVETWVENVMRSFTSRNFAVTGPEGQVYGYGRSIWAMIDTETRQPVDILSVRDGLVGKYIETDKPCPIEPMSKVRVSPSAPTATTTKMHYTDVDVNGHVNSAKYIDHLTDLWDMEWHKKFFVSRLEVAYVAESHGDDTLTFLAEETDVNTFCAKIMKTCEASDKPTEVCRCKVVFAPRNS